MTAGELATVALRILGITYLVNAFSGILGWFNLRAFQGVPEFVDTGVGNATLQTTTLVQAVVVGTLGLAFLVNTRVFVRWLFADLGDASVDGSSGALHRLAFGVAGVVIAATAVPHAATASLEMLWYLGGERRHLFQDLVAEQWIPYSASFLAVAAGICVFELAPWLADRMERKRE